MSRLLLLLAAVASLAATSAGGSTASIAAAGAPEPLVVPRGWELDFETSELRVINLPGGSYYFMTFLVTNETEQDRFFAPLLELSTDAGEIMLSGRGVPRSVVNQILQRLGNPLLTDQISVIGQLKRGEENAREALVVWPVGSQVVSEVSVYAVGMSSETRSIRLRDPESGDTRRAVLRKTLMLRHAAPGVLIDVNARQRTGKVLPRTLERYILREPHFRFDEFGNLVTGSGAPAPADESTQTEPTAGGMASPAPASPGPTSPGRPVPAPALDPADQPSPAPRRVDPATRPTNTPRPARRPGGPSPIREVPPV